ncbi:MAG: phage integrase N-terminal SAM-like domain-containing protein [Kangiellaceae bacterium]|nr:phage integrase N-terminal SAM-like domain-containing protein [Kangiellaceae bacterium]
MLELNTILNENTPEFIEQKLVHSLKEFFEKKNLPQQLVHQHLFWVIKYVRFHNGQHPSDLTKPDLETFLSSLATVLNLPKATQLKALISLNFIYQEFLGIKLGACQFIEYKNRRGFRDHVNPKCCSAILKHLSGSCLLMAKLAYFCNMKLREVATVKITDIDLKKNTIRVSDLNGNYKYSVNIPMKLILDIRIQKMRTQQAKKNRHYLNPPPPPTDKNIAVATQVNSLSQINLFTESKLFLFPYKHEDRSSTQNNEKQLAVLKNDIKLALQRYLRFNRIPSLKSEMDINDEDSILNAQLLRTKFTPMKIAKPHQSAFHFSNEGKGMIEFSRGAA